MIIVMDFLFSLLSAYRYDDDAVDDGDDDDYYDDDQKQN